MFENSHNTIRCCTVLQQVRSFLPQLAKANVELEERMKADADAVNIEHISDGYNGDIIEMVRLHFVAF